MNISAAYDQWSAQYDANNNKTRELEARVLKEVLAQFDFTNVLEIGCGTGKNTVWLSGKSNSVKAVDFSDGMLEKARQRTYEGKVEFIKADINNEWNFADTNVDLIVCSLVLEHIQVLQDFFIKAASVLERNGICYIGELHPFKQYNGSKARFETVDGVSVLECFTHHISEYIKTAKSAGFKLIELDEHFDNGEDQGLPRLVSFVFKKT